MGKLVVCRVHIAALFMNGGDKPRADACWKAATDETGIQEISKERCQNPDLLLVAMLILHIIG